VQNNRIPSPQNYLPLPHAPSYRRDNLLISDSNQTALAFLDRWPEWGNPACVLWGPPGCGKTHLAHIWADAASAKIITSATTMEGVIPQVLAGQSLAVLRLPGTLPALELLHLLNAAKQGGASLLLCGSMQVGEWGYALPDLQSRLLALPQVEIYPPDDTLCRMVMTKLLADRQLRLSPEVMEYALLRLPRSYAALNEFVQILDQFSLAEKRGIGLSLVREVLAIVTQSELPTA
jgi:chromosomal replication initiation ATPase DnaA